MNCNFEVYFCSKLKFELITVLLSSLSKVFQIIREIIASEIIARIWFEGYYDVDTMKKSSGKDVNLAIKTFENHFLAFL